MHPVCLSRRAGYPQRFDVPLRVKEPLREVFHTWLLLVWIPNFCSLDLSAPLSTAQCSSNGTYPFLEPHA